MIKGIALAFGCLVMAFVGLVIALSGLPVIGLLWFGFCLLLAILMLIAGFTR